MTTGLYLPVNLRKQALNHACLLLLAPRRSPVWPATFSLAPSLETGPAGAMSIERCQFSPGDNIQPITPTNSRNYSLSPLARLGVLLAFGHAARGTQAASLPDSPYALLPSKSRHQMLSPHN
jgi:hypothetical protein